MTQMVHLVNTSIINAQRSCVANLRTSYNRISDFNDVFENEFYKHCEHTRQSTSLAKLLENPSFFLRLQDGSADQFFSRPNDEIGKLKYSIQVFLFLRKLCQQKNQENETILPFKNRQIIFHVIDIIDFCKLNERIFRPAFINATSFTFR